MSRVPGTRSERREVPEWVYVWSWARRQGARRPFPQQAPALNVKERAMMLTEDEYEHLRTLWIAAGSPLHEVRYTSRD